MRAGIMVTVATAMLGASMPANAAQLTARDVVVALFKAPIGAPPDFSGQDMGGLDFAGLDFKGANLANANLFGADLSAANLTKANLANARLDRATIKAAKFDHANLSGASILRPNIFSTLGATANELPSFAGATLVEAHLSGRLDQVSFRGADLTRAFFGAKDPRSEELITARVELNDCDFTGAVLRGADLSLNAAQNAKFVGADLRGANFVRANLKAADFTGADLADANFTGAVLDRAIFKNAKGLDRAKGLHLTAP